jgi:uncharacterized protein (DUF885 family)
LSHSIDQLAREYLERTWECFPTRATEDGEHTYDHLLDDLTDANLDGYAASLRALRERVRAVEVDGAEDEADRDALVARIDEVVLSHEVERPPHRNPFAAATAIPNALLDLLARDFAPLETRMRSAAARLDAVPRFLDQARVLLDEPCPALWRRMAVNAAANAATFLAEDVPRAAAGTAVAGRVAEAAASAADALREFGRWLESEHPARVGGDAPFAIGEAALARRLREAHRLEGTPADLLALGEAQIGEITDALAEQAGRLGGGDWAATLAEVKDHHPGAGELLPAYTAELARLEHFVLESDLVTDPQAKVLVEPTPEFLRDFAGYAAYYPAGPFDPYQQGYFWVTPPPEEAGLRDHSYAGIPGVSAHEGYPGHHLQVTTVNRLDSVTRRALRSTVMAEGWGLYTEQLMHDAGYYTPQARLVQLGMRLLRALRIVLDMGLQTGTLSYDEAVAKAVDVAKISEPIARSEVARYTMTPTQPSSYLVGALQLERLRAAVEADLGAGFRKRDFHDRVLSYGHMPPGLIARAMGYPGDLGTRGT